MEKITWTEAMSVGNKELDRQHQQLFELINRLAEYQNNLLDSGESIRMDYVQDILNELANYASYHFEYEEMLLRGVAYDQFNTHRQSHLQYVERVAELLVDGIQGNINFSNILIFVRDWWVDHVLHSDMQYKGWCS